MRATRSFVCGKFFYGGVERCTVVRCPKPKAKTTMCTNMKQKNVMNDNDGELEPIFDPGTRWIGGTR